MWFSLKRIYYISLLLILVLITACTDRDRLNPLDPKNPDTLGRPTGVKVFSIQDTVYLNWNLIKLNDLSGYQIYRKTNLAEDFTPLQMVPPAINSFKDVGVEFGIEYVYQITAVGSNYESAPSESANIIPGPTVNWAANNFNGQLMKLSHDSQHEIGRTSGFFTIIDIEPNPNTGDVWVLEMISSINGNAQKISSEGEMLIPPIEFSSPSDAAIDEKFNALWVADLQDGVVSKFDSSGNKLITVNNFSHPISIAIDQRNGDCWVADSQLNQIAKISSNGSQLMFAPVVLNSVQWLAVNSTDGTVWVADSSRVIRLDETGRIELELNENFNFAFKVAVNILTGDVWVLNLDPSTVSKYTAAGAKMFEVEGFFSPGDLSINLFDHSCLVADTGNNRLVRLTVDGKIASIFNEIGFPDAVKVQNQPIAISEN